MPNMDPKKCPMPSQEPNVRNKNFKEVALGYTEEMAINEAKRCLQCKNHPCRSGCPVEIDIPGFIKHVAEGDFETAYNVIAQSSATAARSASAQPRTATTYIPSPLPPPPTATRSLSSALAPPA